MGEAELVQHVTQVLASSPRPMRAREIAAQLKKQGIDVDRTAVNSVLYKHEQTTFTKEDDHCWTAVSPAKGSSVKASPAKGSSPAVGAKGSSPAVGAKGSSSTVSAKSATSVASQVASNQSSSAKAPSATVKASA